MRYRRPHGTEWEDLDLDTAMEMIADRVMKTRAESWQEYVGEPGKRVRRTHGYCFARRGHAGQRRELPDAKLYTAMGAVQIENQARI